MFVIPRPLLLLAPLLVLGCDAAPSTAPVPAHHDMANMPAHASKADRPAPAAKVNTVVIDNFAFAPAELMVPVGTEVTWVNHDDVPHTATSSAKPKAFDSGALDTDQTYSHTFTAPGEYEYFCAVHPKMTGRVVVK